jgi:hypothetical protein
MNYDALLNSFSPSCCRLMRGSRLSARAGGIERDIENGRATRYGNLQRADDNPRVLEAGLQTLSADQKELQKRLQAEQSVRAACKAWLDGLPAGTPCHHTALPDAPVSDGASGSPAFLSFAFRAKRTLIKPRGGNPWRPRLLLRRDAR